MRERRGTLTGIAALVAGLALLIGAPAAGATVFTVNTTADHVDQTACNAADCTIREALSAATPGTDSVSVPAGLYTLDPRLGPLFLDGDTLNGAGARATILDGGLQTRVINADINPNVNTVAPQISGVTVRRGNGIDPVGSPINNGDGGGIVVSGALGVSNSQIVNNTAGRGGGIGLESGANLSMVGSTVAANTAGTQGGGVWNANEGIIAVANSTITANVVNNGTGGGIWSGGMSVALLNVTVASNSARSGGGIDADPRTLRNTIVAGNSGGQCSTATTATSNNSLASDGTCALVGTGNQSFVNPVLGPLTNNGGPTDTRSIGPTSPATNHGGAGCQAKDQRGVARPQGGACDIGAFEYRPPRLTVFKHVVNDDGGTQAAGDFTIHVRSGSADVVDSPQPGSETGRTYVRLTPGTYTVGEDADSRYRASFSGNCTSAGVVTLTEGSVKTCMVTNNDKPPVVGRIVNAEPEGGTVKIKLPHRKRFRRMTEGEQLPVGTIVDTRNGRIGLVAAANKKGGRATADFYDGLFRLGQTKGKHPITVLTLVEKLTGCTAQGKATTARKKKRKRRLWGDGHGRFQTKGRHSAATVVGTKWLVEDRCTSTLTRVARGRVKVRDFVKHKTVFVRKGHKYIAQAK